MEHRSVLTQRVTSKVARRLSQRLVSCAAQMDVISRL